MTAHGDGFWFCNRKLNTEIDRWGIWLQENYSKFASLSCLAKERRIPVISDYKIEIYICSREQVTNEVHNHTSTGMLSCDNTLGFGTLWAASVKIFLLYGDENEHLTLYMDTAQRH